MIRLSDIKEMWGYLKANKKWWLVPIILLLAIFGAIMIGVFSSPVAPILYPLF